jgi:hypothetical protein
VTKMQASVAECKHQLNVLQQRYIFHFLVNLLVFGVCLQPVTSRRTKQHTVKGLVNETTDFVVSAYLPEYRFTNSKIDQIAEHITDLILFSAEPQANGDIAMMNRFPTEVMDAVGKARASGLRVFLCVGGGGRSSGFSSLASDAAARRKFSLKLLDACKSMGLDGVDLDWEGDLDSDPKKWNNFGLLLNDIHGLFIKESKDGEPKLLLSIAVHVGQETAVTPEVIKVRLHWQLNNPPHDSQPESWLPSVCDCACSQSVDRVHLMAYDRCAQVPCEHSTPADADAAVRSALKVRAQSRVPCRACTLPALAALTGA